MDINRVEKEIRDVVVRKKSRAFAEDRKRKNK